MIVGCILLIAGISLAFWEAFVLMKIINWLIIDILPIDPLNFSHCVGIIFVAQIIKGIPPSKKDETPDPWFIMKEVVKDAAVLGILLLAAWVAS